MSAPRSTSPVRAGTTQAIEDYLKVAFKLASRGGRATVVEMARRLNVSAPSVTNMVKKMRAMGLVDHPAYGGVGLTPRGARIALEIIRHHRLWELYLTRRLGMPLEAVHDEAERLEHVLSDRMEERMAALLGDPGLDPHGDPIPTRDGVLRAGPDGRRLSDLAPGESAVVAHISDRHAEHVRTMRSTGLMPGVRVRMVRPGQGPSPILLRVGARRRSVSHEVAQLVRVV